MKSLHQLMPICAVVLCTQLVASAAAEAATSNTHAAMTQTAPLTRIAPAATIKQVGTLSSASSSSSTTNLTATVPRTTVARESNPQMANQYCVAHWQDSTCRGVVALHDEALKMQQKDGGKLTPQHLKELQSKLDAVMADVQSKLDAERQPSG